MEASGMKRGGNLSNRSYYFSFRTECFATVWTNDYIPDQLDAGKNTVAQFWELSINSLAFPKSLMCHLDDSNLSLKLCTYVINFPM